MTESESRPAPGYPRPDRSDQTPNFVKSPENEVVDIGWNEGVMRDGRPWRLEAWATDGVTMLTYFFSRNGIARHDDAQLAALLEQEGLLRFTGESRYVEGAPLMDASGNELWSVNVVVGDEEGTFVEDTVPVRPHPPVVPREARYTTMDPEDAWPLVRTALAGVLRGLPDDQVLILDDESTHRFVQFVAYDAATAIRAEAKSNHYVEEDYLLLSDDEMARLVALGWNAPTYVPEVGTPTSDHGSPNFWIDAEPPVDHEALATLAVTTLREVYGVFHPGELVYASFVPATGIKFRLPELGIDRRGA